MPIFYVYSRREEVNDTCRAPTLSGSNPLPVNPSLTKTLGIPMFHCKGKHLCQLEIY